MRRTRPQPHLLTTSAAADALGVSHDTVARMVDAGELAATRTPGGHRRIPRAAVEAIVWGRAA